MLLGGLAVRTQQVWEMLLMPRCVFIGVQTAATGMLILRSRSATDFMSISLRGLRFVGFAIVAMGDLVSQ